MKEEIQAAATRGELSLFGCGLRVRRLSARRGRRLSKEEIAIADAFPEYPDELPDGYGDREFAPGCEEELKP